MTRVWFERGGVLLVLLVVGWAAGSALRGKQAADWPKRSAKMRVLTTIFPLYDFARQLGGPDIEEVNLLPPGVDPHEFALSPHDVALVAGADVLIANGVGLDDFLTEAIRKAGVSGKPVVRCAEGLMAGSGEHVDPHLWLDPVAARVYVHRIGKALAAEAMRRGDAQAANSIRKRAAQYDDALIRLDREYGEALAPLRGRAFIAFHGAFGHLAERYGLTIAAVWETTPGREPSPREVGAILQLAKQRHVRALFSEPQFSPRALEIIAADSGLPVYSLDPLETATDFAHTHYLEVMRANLKTLARALQ